MNAGSDSDEEDPNIPINNSLILRNSEFIFGYDVSVIFSLNLSSLKLATMKGLEACKNLHLLNLRDNFIQNLAPLHHFPKLQVLDLSRNKLTKLRETDFQSSCCLRVLKLEGNQIGNMRDVERSLASLKVLEYLSLRISDDSGQTATNPVCEGVDYSSQYLLNNSLPSSLLFIDEKCIALEKVVDSIEEDATKNSSSMVAQQYKKQLATKWVNASDYINIEEHIPATANTSTMENLDLEIETCEARIWKLLLKNQNCS